MSDKDLQRVRVKNGALNANCGKAKSPPQPKAQRVAHLLLLARM
jgi:hypothetical protein